MADTTVATPTQVPSQQSQSAGRNRRGGRGGRGRGRGGRGGHQPSATQPAPQQQGPQPDTLPALQTRGTGRRFRGQLTHNEPSFRPQAPSFVPATIAPAPTSSRPQSRASQASTVDQANASAKAVQNLTRRTSRSTAPDLATRIHEDISHNVYECAICSNEVGRKSKVWSCNTCWTVFHIGCIKKWAKNDGSAVHRQSAPENEDNPGKQWRCPGCNLPKDVQPSNYTCWCEKELDPKNINGLPPHSCGQTCGRDRKFPKACPHPCDQLCHAGPCPPCTSIGPVQSCFCGKQSSTRRCLETNYEAGWSCGEICGDIMPCGEHSCQRPCHEGLCGACTVDIPAKCYCGKVDKILPCNHKSDEKDSYSWTGIFDCRQTCGRSYDCGKHACEQLCHPQDETPAHCPRSPDLVSHCPCGKTLLSTLLNSERTDCSDAIPSCSKPCNKTLPCGHTCTTTCHAGDCDPCFKKVPIKCRCGRESFHTTCHGGTTEPPFCFKMCNTQLNCGRHICQERCCPGERLAHQRLAAKRGRKAFVDINGTRHAPREDFEAEHICTDVCGRPLKCGNHNCTDLCHRGPCASCKEAIFEDISCDCGRTTIQAPLPCGTRPPHCNFPCERQKTCGHPQVSHTCHTSEEECPKCPFLTEKACMCGKKTLKNQPCWRTDVICGLVCGRTLKCGSHTCQKTCHRPGECEDANQHCQQWCGKSKKTCGHPCEYPCHAPSTCKEDKPCPFKIIIACDCQRRREEVKCNARAGVPDPPGRQNSLKCDDECARLERNRKLAAALHIPDDHMDDHVPYSTNTLRLYVENPSWCHEQEDLLRLFAADSNEKRFTFKPMRPKQRAFIHYLAEDFGFETEALDPEGHRFVQVFRTPKFTREPFKTLAQAARIKKAQLNIQAPVDGIVTPERRADEVEPPQYNGLLLKLPRFALTEDELRPILRSAAPTNDFEIIFLSASDGVALIPRDVWDSPEQLQVLLQTLQPIVSAAVSRDGLAASAVLCEYDLNANRPEPHILQEAGQGPGGKLTGGWSQVASKRSGPSAAPTVAPVGQKSSYTVLGSKLAEAKKKREQEKELERRRKQLLEEDVVDDWSAEVEREEKEEETRSRGVSDGEQEPVPTTT